MLRTIYFAIYTICYMLRIIFVISILLVCKRKNWSKFFAVIFLILGWSWNKHIDCCKDRTRHISHVWNIFGYAWNLKIRNNIGEVAVKKFDIIRRHFTHTYFLMFKLLKYNFVVVLSSFLQKFHCLLHFNLHAFFISNAFFQLSLSFAWLFHEFSFKCCLGVA